jgi:predicted dehydrogenase
VLARPDIDAVYVATPEHWHALVTIAAARAGKHVYCQKPLTRTIAEGQAVVNAVRRHDIVFQHGTQQRDDPAMLFGCELVRNGYIGQLRHVQIASRCSRSASARTTGSNWPAPTASRFRTSSNA